MLNHEGQFAYQHQSTSFPHIVNRSYTNYIDVDCIIYIVTHKFTPAERMVLLACIKLGKKYGEFRALIDTLALMSGVSHSQVTRALKTLFRHNYVRRWNLGGIPRYVVADELLSVNFTNIGYDIKFHSNNEPETILDSYIYTHETESQIVKLLDQGETLRVATGYYPSATVARGASSRVSPQMEHIGESMSVVESYIAPYVHEITDIPLSFGDKYQLSQWSQRIVATALRVMRAKEKNPRTFAYLSGICRHVAGKTSGKTNDFTKSKPAKYRFENDPVTLDSHVIDLEEERMEKEQMAFLMGREYIANSTSGSELLDYNVKRMLAIQADKKAAEEEVIRLTNDGIAIGDFIKEIRELNQWNPKVDIEDIEWMIAEYEYTNSLQNTRVTENNTEGAIAHEVSH